MATREPYERPAGDVFVIELDETSWRADGDVVTAPHSLIAYQDRWGGPVVGETVRADGVRRTSEGEPFEDWTRTWFSTDAALPAGSHSLYFSVADIGDASHDTLVGFEYLSFQQPYEGESCPVGTAPAS